MKNMKENKSKKFKILASVLGIVLGVTAIFAPACATKSVDDTYINDKGELVVVYTDGTEKNLGVVKGEDGKDGVNGLDGKDGKDGVNGADGKDGIDGVNGTDGKDGIDGEDGKDLTACTHEYGDWQTEIEATCSSIGYDTRTCALCGDLDYRFNEAGSHNYDLKTAVSVMGDCTERWVNASCKTCGDTTLKKVNNHHYYDENGVCTECGFHVHYFDYEKDVEVVTNTCAERIINVTCELCFETFTFEEEPVIEHIYADGVCTECGTLRYCAHGKFNCEECEFHRHDFPYIETVSFVDGKNHWGKTKCLYCEKVLFRKLYSNHSYDYENAVDVINTCEEHWVNAPCTECKQVQLIETYVKHPYDKNGVCTECGDITHFIESEEYFNENTWWSIDKSYGLVLIILPASIPVTPEYIIFSYVGTPVDVIIPAGFNGIPITSIGGYYGYGGYVEPFKNCESIETLIFPDDVILYGYVDYPNLKFRYKKSEVPEEYMYMININYKENE